MVFVRCDNSTTWTAEDGLERCPQIVRIDSADTPYVLVDYSNVLGSDVAIASVTTPTEIDSQTITIADASVSADGKKVSFKVSLMAAGTYVLLVPVTLSDGTTNVISRECTLIVT